MFTLARRRTLRAALAAAVVQTLRGHGVVNGAESDGLGVFASFDGRLETEGLLQALHLTDDVFSHEGDNGAGGAGSTGATRAVQVVGRLRRRVVMDDHGEQFDVDPSRGDVSRDQHLNLTVLHTAQRSLALGLRTVTVQGNG